MCVLYLSAWNFWPSWPLDKHDKLNHTLGRKFRNGRVPPTMCYKKDQSHHLPGPFSLKHLLISIMTCFAQVRYISPMWNGNCRDWSGLPWPAMFKATTTYLTYFERFTMITYLKILVSVGFLDSLSMFQQLGWNCRSSTCTSVMNKFLQKSRQMMLLTCTWCYLLGSISILNGKLYIRQYLSGTWICTTRSTLRNLCSWSKTSRMNCSNICCPCNTCKKGKSSEAILACPGK